MFFAEYIQILHKHISLGVNRPCFTEEFLCHASTKLQEGMYSDSSYKNYFRGATEGKGKHAPVIGDRIGKFAFDNLQSIDNCSLDKYLSNLIEKAKAESELRIAFQKHFAQLPPDTGGDDANESIKDNNGEIISKGIVQLAKQTRRLFVVTINDVIFTYSHTKKNHSSSSHDEPAASQDETASTQVEEAERSSDSGPKTGSVKLLEPDRIEIAGILKRLTKIIDRIFTMHCNTANGAKASATLYSIIATAQANGLDVEKYLAKLFSQPAGTILLPWDT